MSRHLKLYVMLVVALLLTFVLVVLAWANDPVRLGEGHVVETVEPAEDDPAWDCEIHGNERCGPGKLGGEIDR